MSAPMEFSKLFDTKKVYKQQYTSSLSLPFSHQQPVVGFCAAKEEDVERLEGVIEGVHDMKMPLIIFWSGAERLPAQMYERATVVTPRDTHYTAMWRACDNVY